MDVTELLKVYGAGGVQVALLVMFFWFVRRLAEAMDRIPPAIAATGEMHKGEVQAIVHAHREEVAQILAAHSAQLNEQGGRFDQTLILLAKRRVEDSPVES